MNIYDSWSEDAKKLHQSIKNHDVICGSGHRPPRLGLEYSKKHNELLTHFAKLQLEQLSISTDYIISGAALGWDSAISHAAFLLKIPYIMAIPFKGFSNKWSPTDRFRFNRLCKNAAYSIYICDGDYDNSKYFSRDVWMIHTSKTLLGLKDNKPDKSGTGITFNYAKEQGIKVINLWDKWEEYRKIHTG